MIHSENVNLPQVGEAATLVDIDRQVFQPNQPNQPTKRTKPTNQTTQPTNITIGASPPSLPSPRNGKTSATHQPSMARLRHVKGETPRLSHLGRSPLLSRPPIDGDGASWLVGSWRSQLFRPLVTTPSSF